MHWKFETDDAYRALSARASFVSFLHSHCTPGSDIEAAEVIYGELISNVVRHAPGRVTVEARIDPFGLVTLDVWDCGPGYVLDPSLPPSKEECGRGLFIVWKLSKHVSCERSGGVTRVSAVLPVNARVGDGITSPT